MPKKLNGFRNQVLSQNLSSPNLKWVNTYVLNGMDKYLCGKYYGCVAKPHVVTFNKLGLTTTIFGLKIRGVGVANLIWNSSSLDHV